jgi:hypothetical protein
MSVAETAGAATELKLGVLLFIPQYNMYFYLCVYPHMVLVLLEPVKKSDWNWWQAQLQMRHAGCLRYNAMIYE